MFYTSMLVRMMGMIKRQLLLGKPGTPARKLGG